MVDERMRQIFLENTAATPEQIDRAAEVAERTGESLGAVLQMLGAVTEEERVRCLALKLDLEYVDLDANPPSPELLRLVPAEVLRRYRAVPVRIHVTLALPNPLDVMSSELVAEIGEAVGCPVTTAVASEKEIARVLAALETEAPAAEPEPIPAVDEPEAAAEPAPPLPEAIDEPEAPEPEVVAQEPVVETAPEAEAPVAEPAPEAEAPVAEPAPEAEPAPDEAGPEDLAPEDLASVYEQLTTHDAKFLEALRQEVPLPDKAVAEAAAWARENAQDLGRALVHRTAITEAERVKAEGRLWGFDFFDLSDFEPDPDVVHIVHIDQLVRCGVLPVRLEDTTLYVAAVDPLDLNAIDSLTVTTGYQVRAYIAVEADVRRILQSLSQ